MRLARFGNNALGHGREDGIQRAEALAKARQMLIVRFAEGGIPAEWLCPLCWYLAKAGLDGLADLGVRPNQGSSGNYRAHLDRVLGLNATEDYIFGMPMQGKYERFRTIQPMNTNPPHESIFRELFGSGEDAFPKVQ